MARPRAALAEEEIWRRAVALARRGLLTCAPNPAVGAVIIRDGQVAGEGYHRVTGGPHAEIAALEDARRHLRPVRGGILYVTLEPCSTVGRTGACTSAIVAAGIREVHIGTLDPNPAHQGRAVGILEGLGIRVTVHNRPDCEAINYRFNHCMINRRPFVHAKWAMTLDGKLAAHNGQAKWISGERSRRAAHELRALYNAVLVGKGTVLRDDPALSIRLGSRERQPYKIVLDSRAELDYSGRIIAGTPPERLIIAVSPAAPGPRWTALARRGFTVLRTESEPERVALPELLEKLMGLGLTGLLVEGGPTVLGEFFRQRLADRATIFLAPSFIGGLLAPIPVPLASEPGLGPRLRNMTVRHLDGDLRLDGDISYE